MVLISLAMAFEARLFPIAYGEAGQLPPPKLQSQSQRAARGLIALAMVELTALQVTAAFHQQFVLNDRPHRRMRFGRRSGCSVSENSI